METYRLYLDELTVDGNDTDGVLCVYIRVSDKNIADIVQCGDILQFGAKINAIKLADENGTINGSAYRTDVRYIASVKSGDIVQVFGESRLLEKFTSLLKNHLTDNMGEKYGNIAFSMLTGDRHGLDYDISSYFSAVGLGHIMAVSGLHIGFFVFLLNLILRKVSKKVRFPIIAAVLIMYAVLADFSPSVVRAVIMVFISGVGILIGGRRDLLSSLLCAYSFILAVKPFYMFEVGFLLSFGALFGIAVFSGMIRRFLQKNGAYKKIADAIGGSVSATLGIIPAESYFFGNIQLLAAVVNVFLLPYISVVFISVICLLPISAIPYCGSVLTVCKYLLMALDYAAYGISNIPYTIITFSAAGAVFFCYPVMFMAGEHAMLGKSKTAVSWYSLAVCVAIIVLCVL